MLSDYALVSYDRQVRSKLDYRTEPELPHTSPPHSLLLCVRYLLRSMFLC